MVATSSLPSLVASLSMYRWSSMHSFAMLSSWNMKEVPLKPCYFFCFCFTPFLFAMLPFLLFLWTFKRKEMIKVRKHGEITKKWRRTWTTGIFQINVSETVIPDFMERDLSQEIKFYLYFALIMIIDNLFSALCLFYIVNINTIIVQCYLFFILLACQYCFMLMFMIYFRKYHVVFLFVSSSC